MSKLRSFFRFFSWPDIIEFHKWKVKLIFYKGDIPCSYDLVSPAVIDNDNSTVNVFKSKKASRFSTFLCFPALVIISPVKWMDMNPANTCPTT